MTGMVHSRLVATHYYGGKFYLLPYLLKAVPKHHCYVEVFGGGGYLLLNKKRSKVEVYNDINGDVVNLFRVLRDNGDQLIRRLKYTPYSRQLLGEIKAKTEFSDDIERAWAYFILLNQTFNARGRKSGFAYARVKNHANIFKRLVDNLEQVVERLRGVVIECLDWKECMERYESENTFAYCLPPETGVLTTKGVKRISEIAIGDKVFTPQGVQPVMAVLRRRYQGEIIKIQVMGLGRETIRASPDHKFLIRNNKASAAVWKRAEELRPGNYIALGTYRLSHNGKIPVVRDNTRRHGRRKSLKQPQDPYKLAYLAGWFAAEGHYQSGLTFNLGIYESERAIEIKNLIKELFDIDALIKTPPHTPNESVILVQCYSRNLEDYFKQYFVGYRNELGHGAGKYLKEWILYASPEIQINFIRGWLLGDGGLYIVNELSESASFRRKSGKMNIYKYTGTTASEIMAWQIYHLAMRCRLHPCFKRRRKNKDIYFTTIADTNRLLNININGRICKRRFWDDNFLWAPITKVEREYFNGYLYDIALPQVHSYYLYNGILSHNCDPPYPQDTRKDKNIYEHEFTIEDHIKLRDYIKNWSGKICLSTYPSEIYEKLADEGWYKLEIKVSKWSRVLRKDYSGNTKSRAIEVLWMNYEPPQRKII
ncbi:MAG: hypothetical protein DRN49_00110 [Thaumarchaeota archaeon]|nr:MAG: hypothetical protein DRN49_00110 [Nitrososphaerota archaeon]